MVRIPTSLRHAPGEPMDTDAIAAQCQRAWQERGVVVILDVSAVPNAFERQAIVGEAERLYGRRKR